MLRTLLSSSLRGGAARARLQQQATTLAGTGLRAAAAVAAGSQERQQQRLQHGAPMPGEKPGAGRGGGGGYVMGDSLFDQTDHFVHRHVAPSPEEVDEMLGTLGYATLEDFIDSVLPKHVRPGRAEGAGGDGGTLSGLAPPLSEMEALDTLRRMIEEQNIVTKSFVGMGYYETWTPPVILRNILENPGWYTAYTPYQPEVSQGRLEMLLNFQTMVADLTKMEICNASLLDEATAAAEAMTMCHNVCKRKDANRFFAADSCHPQNIALLQTRGEAIGLDVVVGDPDEVDFSAGDFCGALIQYPSTYGHLEDYTHFTERAHESGTMVVAATDLMANVITTPPGEFGVDVVVGSAQRFGVPMAFGGPHAGFLATRDKHSRKMPGRIIGVSVDSNGNQALRMAMQTREQHIRRDKATSNICTAQALLANMAAAYGVYHGPEGLHRISTRIHMLARLTATALYRAGFTVDDSKPFYDTFVVDVSSKDLTAQQVQDMATSNGCSVRIISDTQVGISIGETVTRPDIVALMKSFGEVDNAEDLVNAAESATMNSTVGIGSIPGKLSRVSEYMTHPSFNTYHSETEMLRYLKQLENKDISLNTSMITLGSCTMKLNAAAEMIPVTWRGIANMHPFAPVEHTRGYLQMIDSLHKDLAEITGFAAVSSQPNSGAQGEFAGLMCIRAYLNAQGESHRNVCLIPVSAHGTNPASAVMAGMRVVTIKSTPEGYVDMEDMRAKVKKHSSNLAAFMITYPSTFGVFEETIKDMTDMIHEHGGQVYMDGANLNAQVGLTNPATMGADVCHMNLHKTFCIPHGGGGPGVGSIAVARHLAPYLPGHTVVEVGGEGNGTVAKAEGAVSAAPYGSAAILPISWMYIKMLGAHGLRRATSTAILSANYMAERLRGAYDIRFVGSTGRVAHEFIVDLRPFKETAGIAEADVAKRLQDFGFHPPTMSWPVPGTIMVEPTESEDKPELDRFCDALLAIREEIADIENGRISLEDSPLTHAPHTQHVVASSEWNRKYTREQAAYPTDFVRRNKFWPSVGRVDNVYGDRNLICTCPPVSAYADDEDLENAV